MAVNITTEMLKLSITIMVWIVCGLSAFISKKIDPNNGKEYTVWNLFLALVFTLFAVNDWFG